MSEFAARAQRRREADDAKPKSRKGSLLPSDPPDPGATRDELAAWCTVALGIGGDPVKSAERYGKHPDARMVISLRSGQRITFERQGDAFEPRKLTQIVIVATGASLPHYGPADAQKLATVLINLATVVSEDDDRAEANDWADSFLVGVQTVVDVADTATPHGRYEALSILTSWHGPSEPRLGASPAERAIVVRDVTTGRRLARVTDVAAHVRHVAGKPIPWQTIASQLVQVGWEHVGQVQQRQPGGDGRVKARIFVVPADWETA